MDDRDIWRSAKALIDQHGADTAIHAAMRADKLLDAGDLDGAATWRRVILVYTRYSVLNFPDETTAHPSRPAPDPLGGNSCFFC
jgi:hypothetical protein